jgi:hypothetical protein
MANPEHVAIAKSGTERWNAWRQSDPGARGRTFPAPTSKASTWPKVCFTASTLPAPI